MVSATSSGDEIPAGQLESLRGRCVMITVDPDTLERNPEVLKDVGRRFGGRLALDTDIERGGLVRVGDEVTLVRHDQPARAR